VFAWFNLSDGLVFGLLLTVKDLTPKVLYLSRSWQFISVYTDMLLPGSLYTSATSLALFLQGIEELIWLFQDFQCQAIFCPFHLINKQRNTLDLC
jgi:hypothetical protein